MKSSLFILLCCCCAAFAQEECNLGLGGKHHQEIIKVFKLDEDQQEKLKNWGAELKFRNEIFKIRAESLLKNNAQSSPEDLLQMSFQYKILLDSMRANLRLLDKRMLSTFNDYQYNLYIDLCNSIAMSPIYAQRVVNEKRKRRSDKK